MTYFAFRKLLIAALLISALCVPRAPARADANATAALSTVLAGGAAVASAVGLMKTMPQCFSTPQGPECWQAPLYGAAIGVSIAALMQNSEAERQTFQNPIPTPSIPASTDGGGSGGGSTGGFTGTPTVDMCAAGSPLAGTGFCKDGAPNPNLTNLPDACSGPNAASLFVCNPDGGASEWAENFDKLKDAVDKGLITPPEGQSSDEFLSGLDSGMQNLMSKFNPNGKSPGDGAGGSGNTAIAGSGGGGSDFDSASGNSADAGGRKGGGGFGLGKAVKKNGLSLLDDASGKELSLFQRATRLYQGTKEGAVTGTRALSLAKIEKVRSQTLKKLTLAAKPNSENSQVVSLTGIEAKEASKTLKTPVRKVNLPQH